MTMTELDQELERLRGSVLFDDEPVRALYRAALARAEAAEALAYERLESAVFAEQRADDAEVERDELRDANSVLSDALETTRQTLVTLTARAAELEAQLAAQGWRDFAEHPPIGEPIQITTVIDAVREEPDGLYRIGHTSEWQAWRPTPPAPQETTR